MFTIPLTLVPVSSFAPDDWRSVLLKLPQKLSPKGSFYRCLAQSLKPRFWIIIVFR